MVIRKPLKEDGSRVWALVKDSGSLDLNSAYCYIMLCEFFKDTCVLVEKEKELAGFISAYILPGEPETLFIWQVAVKSNFRGKGLAKSMIRDILGRGLNNVRFIKTTVTPSNSASSALFKSIAKELKAECVVENYFPEELFPDKGHEDELLYTIGPF